MNHAIENDETDIALSRLQQVAKVLGVHEWALLLPESGVNIIGEVKDNTGGTNGVNNLFSFGEFSPERDSYKAHIEDLKKQIETQGQTIASLQKMMEALVGK